MCVRVCVYVCLLVGGFSVGVGVGVWFGFLWLLMLRWKIMTIMFHGLCNVKSIIKHHQHHASTDA